jgi:hypothetical protein
MREERRVEMQKADETEIGRFSLVVPPYTHASS